MGAKRKRVNSSDALIILRPVTLKDPQRMSVVEAVRSMPINATKAGGTE